MFDQIEENWIGISTSKRERLVRSAKVNVEKWNSVVVRVEENEQKLMDETTNFSSIFDLRSFPPPPRRPNRFSSSPSAVSVPSNGTVDPNL